jgi:hypothetical protein
MAALDRDGAARIGDSARVQARTASERRASLEKDDAQATKLMRLVE